MPEWASIIRELNDAGASVSTSSVAEPVSGGDISAAWHLQNYFVKTGPAASQDMFAAEAEGLSEIANSHTIRVPEVVAVGSTATTAFIAMEWLAFDRPVDGTERILGERLAAMHRVTGRQFGWHRDNTIGLTLQPNSWCDNWVEFLRDRRIGFQLKLAAENGFTGELQDAGTRLLKRLPVYFEQTATLSSLLHGDLWGGNWASCNGAPVVFDPAVYYGDRESDLAMTKLFGGFSQDFYGAYESSWPLTVGATERMTIYQLYHVLNHLNLFGSGYLGRALQLIKALV